MGQRKRVPLKTKKITFPIRDPTDYPEEYSVLCWREHAVEDAEQALKTLRKAQ